MADETRSDAQATAAAGGSLHDDWVALGETAGSLLDHDVAAPLDLARHLLASVRDDGTIDDVARGRVALVIDALGDVSGHARRVAAALRPSRPGTPRRTSLRGLVAGALLDPAVAPGARCEVELGNGVPDVVTVDATLAHDLLVDLLAFATTSVAEATPPSTVVVAFDRDDAGEWWLRVRDDGTTTAERRFHELGSLCLVRAGRIVGAAVRVEAGEDGVQTSVRLTDALVRGSG